MCISTIVFGYFYTREHTSIQIRRVDFLLSSCLLRRLILNLFILGKETEGLFSEVMTVEGNTLLVSIGYSTQIPLVSLVNVCYRLLLSLLCSEGTLVSFCSTSGFVSVYCTSDLPLVRLWVCLPQSDSFLTTRWRFKLSQDHHERW